MADTKPTKLDPLKRILRKASRSKTSLASPDPAGVETDQNGLERQTSIALTVPDEGDEVPTPLSPTAEDEPQSPVSSKEAKRRGSLVGKLKRLAGDRKEKKPSTVDESPEQTEDAEGVQPLPFSDLSNDLSATGVPPIQVAKRIRDLLTSSPPFYPTTLLAADVPSSPTNGTSGDLFGAKFLTTLSNQLLMQGSEGKESVFSILERTHFSFKANLQAGSVGLNSTTDPDSSIMLYAPLVPDENSKVELAKFKLVKVPVDELDEQTVKAAGWWPPSEWGKKSPPTKTVRVWIPSTTQISVQFAWWGFRLWLPEPVVKVLDDKEMETVKRIAMVSTALGWLVAHIPTTGLPLELLAVLTVAKSIAPIIGYIGGFISWYWSTMKGFDKGQGFVLSATWLLPIALIPGNWNPPAVDPTPATPAPAPGPTPTPAPNPTPTPAPTEPTPPSQPPATNPPVTPAPPPAQPIDPAIITVPGAGGIYST